MQQGAHLYLSDVCYHPVGCEEPLLRNVGLCLGANELGLVFGKSGSGKTTLMQVIAGLNEADSGQVWISEQDLTDGSSDDMPLPLTASERLSRVGMVFQFPERHFLGHNIRSELTFGWPPYEAAVQNRLFKLNWALTVTGLTSFNLDTPTNELSDGFKRRLALAVQLVRRPSVLILDEPLAGLDWKARAEMAKVLSDLKKECSVLVVSHDLREIRPLVDVSWRMQEGQLTAMPPPP